MRTRRARRPGEVGEFRQRLDEQRPAQAAVQTRGEARDRQDREGPAQPAPPRWADVEFDGAGVGPEPSKQVAVVP